MSADKQAITKKKIADNIYNQLTPHFSTLLGSNTGLGIGASSTKGQDFNTALKKWFEHNDPNELIGFLRMAQITGVISEPELDKYLDEIEQVV